MSSDPTTTRAGQHHAVSTLADSKEPMSKHSTGSISKNTTTAAPIDTNTYSSDKVNTNTYGIGKENIDSQDTMQFTTRVKTTNPDGSRKLLSAGFNPLSDSPLQAGGGGFDISRTCLKLPRACLKLPSAGRKLDTHSLVRQPLKEITDRINSPGVGSFKPTLLPAQEHADESLQTYAAHVPFVDLVSNLSQVTTENRRTLINWMVQCVETQG